MVVLLFYSVFLVYRVYFFDTILCMRKKTFEDSIDQIIKNIDFDMDDQAFKKSRGSLTLWISKEYKEKYETLQSKTDKRFSKALQQIFTLAIDKAEKEISKRNEGEGASIPA